jgi:hypothetical protein
MASVGLLQIDFVANLAKFVAPVANAGRVVEQFATRAASALDRVEKSLEKPGIKLTAKLTVPLAALSIASIRAADTNKDFADSMERLALQTQKALQPLGGALIQAFEQIRPSVEDAIRFVNGLAQAFAELEPEMKNQVILVGAVAAGIGPALVGLSAFFTVMKAGTTVLALAGAGIDRFRLQLVAVTSFEFGSYLYDEFADVQFGLAKLVEYAGYAWENIKAGFRTVTTTLEFTWSNAIASMKLAAAGLLTAFSKVLDVIETQIPASLRPYQGNLAGGIGSLGAQLGQEALVNVTEFGAAIGKIAKERKTAVDEIRSVYEESIRSIYVDFGGPEARQRRTGRGFGSFIAEDLAATAKDIGSFLTGQLPALDALNGLLERARSIAATVKLPEVVTKRDLQQMERFNEALERQAAKLKEIQELAGRISDELDPTRAIKRKAIDATQNFFDGGINADQLRTYLARLQKDLNETASKADETLVGKIARSVEEFSSRISDAFADMVVDGKASFDELAKSFLKLQISLIANESIFRPLAQGIAGAIRGAPATAPIVASAMGNVFAGGRLVPFAAGGVFNGPHIFPMAEGGIGLLGEAGPEAVMPLARGANGALGVRAAGGGVTVNVIDQRRSGDRPEVTEATGPDGRKQITVMIRDVVQAGIRSGTFDGAFGSSFGLNRRPGGR